MQPTPISADSIFIRIRMPESVARPGLVTDTDIIRAIQGKLRQHCPALRCLGGGAEVGNSFFMVPFDELKLEIYPDAALSMIEAALAEIGLLDWASIIYFDAEDLAWRCPRRGRGFESEYFTPSNIQSEWRAELDRLRELGARLIAEVAQS